MEVRLKQINDFILTSVRKRWLSDPIVRRYFDHPKKTIMDKKNRSAFNYNYEIYLDNSLVGDIKVFGSKKDFSKRIAQVLVVIGEGRGRGIGTKAMALLLENIKEMFSSVYCTVNRYNIPSVKMLLKNGFKFSDLKGSNFILTKKLSPAE